MIRAFLTLFWTELKLELREPIGAFFTLIFPLVLLFTFGSIFGNTPSEALGGRGSVDVAVPGYIAMIIGTQGLLTLPSTLAAYRERGILRRYSISPVNPMIVLVAQALVGLIFVTIGVVLLLIAGRVFYNLSLPIAPFPLIGAYLVGYASFMALGFALAGIIPTARTAQTVGMAIYFPMLFLSGAALPRAIFPEAVRVVSDFLPLTHVTLLIDGIWSNANWHLISLAVLVGLLIFGGILSAKTFRWE